MDKFFALVIESLLTASFILDKSKREEAWEAISGTRCPHHLRGKGLEEIQDELETRHVVLTSRLAAESSISDRANTIRKLDNINALQRWLRQG